MIKCQTPDCENEFSGKIIDRSLANSDSPLKDEPLQPSTICQECHDKAYREMAKE